MSINLLIKRLLTHSMKRSISSRKNGNQLRFFSSKICHNILGIETSCDDTGCAIVNTEGKLLGECLISQQEIHTQLGGIIPPIARDMHKKNMDKVVNGALSAAGLTMSEIDAVAVTVKPGLPLSLAIGIKCAKELSVMAKKPLIPIHHMEAHALTIRMIEKIEFPFLVLLISGGHCLIAVAKSVNEFLLLGKTFDDAPGEAFDKIARRLKIWNLDGYDGLSGGRAMELLSKSGNPVAFPVAEPLLHLNDCNFSFAGIKNSARELILDQEEKLGIEGGEVLPNISDICASVQLAITKHLCRRLQRAMTFVQQCSLIPPNMQNLVVSGGVAANSAIREGLSQLCTEMEYNLHVPPPQLCTDNGIMIAWNGVEKWKQGIDITPHDRLDQIDLQGKAPFGVDICDEVARAGIKCRWVKNIFSQKAYYVSRQL